MRGVTQSRWDYVNVRGYRHLRSFGGRTQPVRYPPLGDCGGYRASLSRALPGSVSQPLSLLYPDGATESLESCVRRIRDCAGNLSSLSAMSAGAASLGWTAPPDCRATPFCPSGRASGRCPFRSGSVHKEGTYTTGKVVGGRLRTLTTATDHIFITRLS